GRTRLTDEPGQTRPRQTRLTSNWAKPARLQTPPNPAQPGYEQTRLNPKPANSKPGGTRPGTTRL
ncbi:MAG: hypothetical protein QGG54_19255, partial [Gammaproteobacteria bacterium]|nr:hypothetical protein [Gammaproteobacteria bacterium]